LDQILDEIPKEVVIRIVDFHAEATSEKMAIAHYAKGRVSAVLGTHTHVQTADEQILLGGTGYISDVGMTGAFHSILGVETEAVLNRFLTHLPTRFNPADGPGQLDAVVLDIEEKTGKAISIERVQWRE
jgi:calcineurin-like phosphoesterase